MPRSTFHKRVEEGKIIPMKGMRGFYLLNESLRRLGLREVRELPKGGSTRSLEDIVRLAFQRHRSGSFPGSVVAAPFRDRPQGCRSCTNAVRPIPGKGGFI